MQAGLVSDASLFRTTWTLRDECARLRSRTTGMTEVSLVHYYDDELRANLGYGIIRDSRPVFIQSPLLEKLGHRKAARQLLFSKFL